MRFLGFLIIVAALVTGGIGIHERREASPGLDGFERMKPVTAAGLLSARHGAQVMIEGTVASGTEVEAPISKDEVAWWSVERLLHTQVESTNCTGDSCTDTTRQVLSELGVESSDRLDVDVGGDDDTVITLTVPHDPKAVFGLRRHDSGTESDASGGDGWVEARESVLVPGDRVTVAGRFAGTGSDGPLLSKVDGVALVHVGSRDESLHALRADRRSAEKTIGWAIAGILAGIALFVIGRRRARARHAAVLLRREAAAAAEAAELAEADTGTDAAAPTEFAGSASVPGEQQGAGTGSTEHAE